MRPTPWMRLANILVFVAVAAAVAWIVVTDSVGGWPVPVLLIALITYIYTRPRLSAGPERPARARNQVHSGPANDAVSSTTADWIVIALAGIGAVVVIGVVLLVLLIYVGLAGCVPVVGLLVGAPCS